MSISSDDFWTDSDFSDEDLELLLSATSKNKRKSLLVDVAVADHGGSRKEKRANVDREYGDVHERLQRYYFNETPKYDHDISASI